ncbi:hypothetical protein N7486_010526 [Penicillium sp. IBT 16267x]|nr:hypothetical protein N7486_010526 [Penicillium sp. IBT 16267x]
MQTSGFRCLGLEAKSKHSPSKQDLDPCSDDDRPDATPVSPMAVVVPAPDYSQRTMAKGFLISGKPGLTSHEATKDDL